MERSLGSGVKVPSPMACWGAEAEEAVVATVSGDFGVATSAAVELSGFSVEELLLTGEVVEADDVEGGVATAAMMIRW
jgi:hypothetical protein